MIGAVARLRMLLPASGVALTLATGACGGRGDGPAESETTPRLELHGEGGAERPAATGPVAELEGKLARGAAREAAEGLRAHLTGHPGDARALYDLGLALEQLDDAAGARAAYEGAVRAAPRFPEPHNNLGLLVRAAGDASGAAARFRSALALDPRFADAAVNLALALEEAGELEAAAEAYDAALVLVPGDALTRANHGLLLLRLGRREAARAVLERAFADAPRDDVATLLAVGNGLRRAGATAAAVEALDAAVKAHEGGGTPALLAELGLALLAARDGARAEAVLAEAVGRDPRYATGHYLLGSVLAARGAWAEAATRFERALALEPGAPFAAEAKAKLERARAARRSPASR